METFPSSTETLFVTVLGISLIIPVLRLVTGRRLLYRPLTGVNEIISVGIARAKNGDVSPAGEKFCEALHKVAKTHRTSI